MDAARFDKFEGNDRGAFAAAGAPYEADDAEADAIWAAVDARLDAKSAASRAAREEEEAKATAATNISGQVKRREWRKAGLSPSLHPVFLLTPFLLPFLSSRT